MTRSARQIYVHIVAVLILGSNDAPVIVIKKLNLIQLLTENLAVNIDSAIGIKSSHLVLSGLYSHLIPSAFRRYLIRRHLKGYRLKSLRPCAAADSVIKHIYRT